MKKFLTLMLAVLMLVSSVVVLSSCGAKPKLDLEKAADNLEDEDYTVTFIDDEDDISEPGAVEYLSARDGDDYIKIYKFKKSSTAKLYYEALKMEHEHEIEKAELAIKAMKHQLKYYDDDLSSSMKKLAEEYIEDAEKELKKLKDQEEYTFGRSGKYVWEGTPDAIKDSKG